MDGTRRCVKCTRNKKPWIPLAFAAWASLVIGPGAWVKREESMIVRWAGLLLCTIQGQVKQKHWGDSPPASLTPHKWRVSALRRRPTDFGYSPLSCLNIYTHPTLSYQRTHIYQVGRPHPNSSHLLYIQQRSQSYCRDYDLKSQLMIDC